MSAKAGVVVWLTGLPASGKSALAEQAAERLAAAGRPAVLLDGDAVREAMVPHPGYTPEERDDFYCSLGNLAALLARQGHTVLVPATANLRRYRDRARVAAPRFIEVHVATPLEECRRRDPKGLYADDKHRVASLPGVGAIYEPPQAPEVTATGGHDEGAVARIHALTLGR